MAFLRGKTFEEIAKTLGVSNERTLQFDLPRDGPELLRGTTEEFRTFDERVETLDMIRPGFGTTDAPWAWSLDLHEFLTSQGFKPTTADSKLYVLHVNGCLSAQVVVHVDDLKGASPAKVRDWIFSIFKERYDEITTSEPPFECVGIFHTQAPDYTIQISQDHYVKQLRPMVVPGLENLSDDIFVAWSVIALFQSLLGAIAWLSLTRGDTLVFVGRFQRCSKQPTAKDVRDLNKLLKWVKRKTCVITYATLTPPIGLASIADSAYRADDEDCLALRAAIFVIIEVRKGVPGGRMHVLDYYSKKQSRVNRSTFSAELNNLLEASEFAMLIASAVHESMRGVDSIRNLVRQVDVGDLAIDIHLVGDAHAVWSAIANRTDKPPNEKQLLLTLKAMRSYIETGQICAIHRCDTRDMVVDCMTKGSISREPLLKACASGEWSMKVTEQVHTWTKTGRQ